MSLNTSHANGGVLIFNGERILIYTDGVEMTFDMDHPITHFKGTKKGRAYLTTHRMIFNNRNSKDALQSFSMPFYTLRGVEIEQPVFGANYIRGQVKAEQGGNWDGNGKWKMWFNKGGAIEFAESMLQAGRLAQQYVPQNPPPYTPPEGPYYKAPPPAYTAPQEPLYAFVPYQTFGTAPPVDGVYSTSAPPPYPGIDPKLTYSPPVESKTGQAFYDPNNPQNVYMPQQPPFGGAPSAGYPNANNSAPPPPGFIPPTYHNGAAPSAPPAPGFQQPGYPAGAQYGYPNGAQNGYPNGAQNGYPNGVQNGYPNGAQNGYPPEGPPPPYSEKMKKNQ